MIGLKRIYRVKWKYNEQNIKGVCVCVCLQNHNPSSETQKRIVLFVQYMFIATDLRTAKKNDVWFYPNPYKSLV